MFNKKIKSRLAELESELGLVWMNDKYSWYENTEDGYMARTARRLKALEEHIKNERPKKN